MTLSSALNWFTGNSDDPYRTLGVSRWANDEEIKRSYRRLAMVHHPDKGGDITVLVNINNAYSFIRKKRGL